MVFDAQKQNWIFAGWGQVKVGIPNKTLVFKSNALLSTICHSWCHHLCMACLCRLFNFILRKFNASRSTCSHKQCCCVKTRFFDRLQLKSTMRDNGIRTRRETAFFFKSLLIQKFIIALFYWNGNYHIKLILMSINDNSNIIDLKYVSSEKLIKLNAQFKSLAIHVTQTMWT